MTAPTIEHLPVRVPGRALSPRLIHGTCVVHLNDLTFCGIDITDRWPLPKSTKPTCVVCADLWDAHGWGKCLEPKP